MKKGDWLVFSAMVAALCVIGFGRFASAVTQVVSVNPPTQSSIKESGINMIFSVRRVGSTLGTLTVNYSIGGTATNGRDYNTLSGTVTILAPNDTAGIPVSIINDTLPEPDETVILTLLPSPDYTIGLQSSAAGTILDDEPIVSLSVTDNEATETNSGAGIFTVTRTGSTTAPLDVRYVVTGIATNGTDYNLLPGTIQIPSSLSSTIIGVIPLDDTLLEQPETVTVTLTGTSKYKLGSPKTGNVKIIDNETLPVVTISATDASANEAGPDSGTFTISRTGDTSQRLDVVSYSVNPADVILVGGGPATNGTDFNELDGSTSIPAGSASITLNVTPVNDVFVEGTEKVAIRIRPSAQYILQTSFSAQIGIFDDDRPVVTITASDANGSEQALDPGQFTIARTGGTSTSVTVTLSFGSLEGDASIGADYLSPRNVFTIPSGQPSIAINITPVEDTVQEGPENVRVTVAPSSNYDVGDPASATIVIADND